MPELKIICSLPNRGENKDEHCQGVLAHLISPRMIQAVRQGDQRFTLTVNQNAQLTLTCPRCVRVQSLIWRKGELDQSQLKLEDVNPPKPDDEPAGDPPADPPADDKDGESDEQ